MESKAIYYYLYKITNLINGHFYYGVHKTVNLNDGYMGSSHRLHKAYQKYGIENFKKEILEFFTNIDDMMNREAEIVTQDLVKDPNCYNLVRGGWGPHYNVPRLFSKLSKESIAKSVQTKKDKGIYKKLSIENSGENNPFFIKNIKNKYEKDMDLGVFLFKYTDIPDTDVLRILQLKCHSDNLFNFYKNRKLLGETLEVRHYLWSNLDFSRASVTNKKKTIFTDSNIKYKFAYYQEEAFNEIVNIKNYFLDNSKSNSSLENRLFEGAETLLKAINYFKQIGVLEYKETVTSEVIVNLNSGKSHKRKAPKDIYDFNFKNVYFLKRNGGLFYVINDNGNIIQESGIRELLNFKS